MTDRNRKTTELHDDIVEALPSLRAFAATLISNRARADDLVHGALVRALDNLDKFENGTNLRAWLFTILRNLYYSELRKRKREVEDVDGHHAERLTTAPDHISVLELRDFKIAFAKLPNEQREALALVGASGTSYEEAARICGCAVGTVKSRVNRGRGRLAEMLRTGTQHGDVGRSHRGSTIDPEAAAAP